MVLKGKDRRALHCLPTNAVRHQRVTEESHDPLFFSFAHLCTFCCLTPLTLLRVRL